MHNNSIKYDPLCMFDHHILVIATCVVPEESLKGFNIY